MIKGEGKVIRLGRSTSWQKSQKGKAIGTAKSPLRNCIRNQNVRNQNSHRNETPYSPHKPGVLCWCWNNGRSDAKSIPTDSMVDMNKQMLRRIKILEARVQEVHQDRQSSVFRLNQQNKHLIDTNECLLRQHEQFVREKDIEVRMLKQEIENLKGKESSQKTATDTQQYVPAAKISELSEQQWQSPNDTQINVTEDVQKQIKDNEQFQKRTSQIAQTIVEEIERIQAHYSSIIEEQELRIQELYHRLEEQQERQQQKHVEQAEQTEIPELKIMGLQTERQTSAAKHLKQQQLNVLSLNSDCSSTSKPQEEQIRKNLEEIESLRLVKLLSADDKENSAETCQKSQSLINSFVKLSKNQMTKTH